METTSTHAGTSLLAKLSLRTVDNYDAYGGQHVAFRIRMTSDVSAEEADVLFETLIRKVSERLAAGPSDRLFVAVELKVDRDSYWAILCPLETVADIDPEECAARFYRKPVVTTGKCHFGQNSLIRVILERAPTGAWVAANK